MEEAQRRQRHRRRQRLYRLRQRLVEGGILLLVAALIAIPIWLLCRSDSPPASADAPSPAVSVPDEPEIPYPVGVDTAADFPAMTDADSALLLDVTENRVIAARRGDAKVYPASVTKIMTLLVAVEQIADYTETFEMPFEMLNRLFIEEASVAGFLAGERVNMTDLLYGCILPSGADATEGLARHLAGSEEGFVRLMNEKAEQLGLKNTHFTNTSGLHHADHYTTAADMAVVLREAMKNTMCRQVLSAVTHTTTATEQHPEGIPLYSTMFSRMYGDEPKVATVTAGKTGYTSQAGHTMASYAVGQDGHEYIFVSMEGSNKWEATYDAIEAYAYYCAPEGSETQPTNYVSQRE